MPGPLKHYNKDPQGLGRGEGEYFHRGSGIYSKYDRHRDFIRISKLRTPRKSKKDREKWKHVEDTKIIRGPGRTLGKI
ncbi:MAG: hypothetical protein DDT41_01379 [candidate division WS2 bacterium]|nr:hypothetical protein [Candidatus Psychracetigena formicireducens]